MDPNPIVIDVVVTHEEEELTHPESSSPSSGVEEVPKIASPSGVPDNQAIIDNVCQKLMLYHQPLDQAIVDRGDSYQTRVAWLVGTAFAIAVLGLSSIVGCTILFYWSLVVGAIVWTLLIFMSIMPLMRVHSIVQWQWMSRHFRMRLEKEFIDVPMENVSDFVTLLNRDPQRARYWSYVCGRLEASQINLLGDPYELALAKGYETHKAIMTRSVMTCVPLAVLARPKLSRLFAAGVKSSRVRNFLEATRKYSKEKQAFLFIMPRYNFEISFREY
jgi:hypothetical protein